MRTILSKIPDKLFFNTMIMVIALVMTLLNLSFAVTLGGKVLSLNTYITKTVDSTEISQRLEELNVLNRALELWVEQNGFDQETENIQELILHHLKRFPNVIVKQIRLTPSESESKFAGSYQIILSGRYPQIMKLMNIIETDFPVGHISSVKIQSLPSGEVSCSMRYKVLDQEAISLTGSN